jgi:hypothetical protein
MTSPQFPFFQRFKRLNSRGLALLLAGLVSVSALPLGRAEAKSPAAPAVASALGASIDLISAKADGVSNDALSLALGAVRCAVSSGDIDLPKTLTLIDYSKPSVEPRLFVYDLATGKLLFKELVAHGKNTGDNFATRFSDEMNSRQSSIGLFVAADTYIGNNGYSLRLDGLEPGFNKHARERAIVMHGAPYVSTQFASAQGRIGRSWGCPALREAIAHQVIDTVKGGGVIFSYYPDQAWLKSSRFLNCGKSPSNVVATH